MLWLVLIAAESFVIDGLAVNSMGNGECRMGINDSDEEMDDGERE